MFPQNLFREKFPASFGSALVAHSLVYGVGGWAAVLQNTGEVGRFDTRWAAVLQAATRWVSISCDAFLEIDHRGLQRLGRPSLQTVDGFARYSERAAEARGLKAEASCSCQSSRPQEGRSSLLLLKLQA